MMRIKSCLKRLKVVGILIGFGVMSIACTHNEDEIDEEHVEEVTVAENKVDNYYNYLLEETEEFVYIYGLHELYKMDKETRGLESVYNAQGLKIMGIQVIEDYIYFTEYEDYSSGDVCRLNLNTKEKEIVLENKVAYEIVNNSDEIYFKLADSNLIGYELEEDKTLGDELDDTSEDFLYIVEKHAYTTDFTEVKGEVISRIGKKSTITDMIYIMQCTEGNELYYTPYDQWYRNVSLFEDEEEKTLFQTQEVAFVTPEGIYHYKDTGIEFFDFETEESNVIASSILQGSMLRYLTYDEEALYILVEDSISAQDSTMSDNIIKINRSNGEQEIIYTQSNVDESITSVAVYDNLLLFLVTNYSMNEGIKIQMLDMESGNVTEIGK